MIKVCMRVCIPHMCIYIYMHSHIPHVHTYIPLHSFSVAIITYTCGNNNEKTMQ